MLTPLQGSFWESKGTVSWPFHEMSSEPRFHYWPAHTGRGFLETGLLLETPPKAERNRKKHPGFSLLPPSNLLPEPPTGWTSPATRRWGTRNIVLCSPEQSKKGQERTREEKGEWPAWSYKRTHCKTFVSLRKGSWFEILVLDFMSLSNTPKPSCTIMPQFFCQF